MSGLAIPSARRPSIRRTLLVYSLVLVLLPSLVIGGVGASLGYWAQLQNTRDQLSAAADLKQREIDRWVEERDSDLAVLATEAGLQQSLQSMLGNPQGSPEKLAAYSELAVRLSAFLRKKVAFVELSLLDAETGMVLVSTEVSAEGAFRTEETYFRRGLDGLFLQPPVFNVAIGAPTILIARPVQGTTGEVQAVLIGRANLADLGTLIQAKMGLGTTGETYLVSKERIYLAGSQAASSTEPVKMVSSSGIRTALSEQNGVGQYVNYQGDDVVGAYRWLPTLRVALLVEQSQSVTLVAAAQQVLTMAGITLTAVALASAAVLSLTRRILQPIVELTEAASQIAAGDLERTAPAQRWDEVDALAQAFNSMTAQLRESITDLEQSVTERTQGLQTAADVARASTSVLDPDELVDQVVALVRERFNLYYVGLFLLDEARRFAVLRAGTGEAGQHMLAEGHMLEVGGKSMIGQCTARAEPRIALDAGAEAMRFDNPLLPETRSELALPLRSRGQVIGAMTVQSQDEAAFDETQVAVMQTMADQVATAIDNARLFAEAQAALREMEAIHQRYLQQAWIGHQATRAVSGYRQVDTTMETLDMEVLPEVHQAVTDQQPVLSDGDGGSSLVVPITLRGQPIGALGFKDRDGNRPWSADEVALVQAICEQFALAAENLRLVDETQRRAAREQLTREVTARMRETLDTDTVLKIAAREIAEALRLHDLTIQLETDETATV